MEERPIEPKKKNIEERCSCFGELDIKNFPSKLSFCSIFFLVYEAEEFFFFPFSKGNINDLEELDIKFISEKNRTPPQSLDLDNKERCSSFAEKIRNPR
jgi:hypothetical protein